MIGWGAGLSHPEAHPSSNRQKRRRDSPRKEEAGAEWGAEELTSPRGAGSPCLGDGRSGRVAGQMRGWCQAPTGWDGLDRAPHREKRGRLEGSYQSHQRHIKSTHILHFIPNITGISQCFFKNKKTQIGGKGTWKIQLQAGVTKYTGVISRHGTEPRRHSSSTLGPAYTHWPRPADHSQCYPHKTLQRWEPEQVTGRRGPTLALNCGGLAFCLLTWFNRLS